MSLRTATLRVCPFFGRTRILNSSILFQLTVVTLLSGLLAPAGLAQARTTLSGTIKDPTGAVVARAVVTLMDTKTLVKKQTAANEAGAYVFTDVDAGAYSVEVSAPGFAIFRNP